MKTGGWGVLLALLLMASPGLRAAPPPDDTLAQRVLACTGCHGEQGRATRDGYYPRIAGKPAGYLYRQLQNFRTGVRHNAVMQQMLSVLSDDYLHEIAGYFAGLHPPYAPAPAPGVSAAALERGRQLALDGDQARGIPACAACHGSALLGVTPDLPGLLGLPADYLRAQLGGWRTHTRRMLAPDCMADIAGKLDEADISAVTAWLSVQPADSAALPQTAPDTPRPLKCGAAP